MAILPPWDITGVETFFCSHNPYWTPDLMTQRTCGVLLKKRETETKRTEEKVSGRCISILLASFLASIPQALPAHKRKITFLYCKWWKTGQGLERRLPCSLIPCIYFRLVFQTPTQVSVSWSTEKCRYLGMRLRVLYTRKQLGTSSVVRWLLITECGLKGCFHSLRRFGVSGKVWWRNTRFLRGKSERSMFDSMLQCVHEFQGEFLFISGQNNNHSPVFRKVSLYVQGCIAAVVV